MYEILREFFRLFGCNNRLYKKYKKKADENSMRLVSERLKHLEYIAAYFIAKTNMKQRWGIELPSEIAESGNKFEYVRIKLQNIKRKWDGKIYSLKQCSPYKYLETGDKKIYEKYIQKHIVRNSVSENTVWDVTQFDALFKSIKKTGYDPTKSVICIDENNIILDGQHRACCLLYLYGGDYEINVVKVSRV